jgi:hypothetical protein
LRDNFRAAFGVATQSLFDALSGTFARMSARIQSPEFLSSMRTTGEQLALVAKRVLALGEFALKHTGAILGLATATVVFGAALSGLRLAHTVTGLMAYLTSLKMARAQTVASAAAQTAATAKNAVAITAETAALAANTVAQKANAAARTQTTSKNLANSMVQNVLYGGTAVRASQVVAQKSLAASMVGQVAGPAVSTAASGASVSAIGSTSTATYTSTALASTAAKTAAFGLGTTIASAFATAIISFGIGWMIGKKIGRSWLEEQEAETNKSAQGLRDRMGEFSGRIGDVSSPAEMSDMYSLIASKLNEYLTQPIGQQDTSVVSGYQRMLDRLAAMTESDFSAAAGRRAAAQAKEQKSQQKSQGDLWGAENSQARQRYFANQFARDEQTSFASALSQAGDDPARQERLMQTRVSLLEKRKADLEATDTRGMDPEAYGELIQRASATADELSELKQRLADFRREIDRTAKAEAAAASEAEKEKKAASALDQQAKAQTAADAKEAYRRSQLTDAERVGELEKRNATIAKQGSAASATDQTEYWNNRIEVDRLKDRMAAAMNAEKSGDVGEAQASGSRPRLTGRAAWRAANNAAQVGRRADGMRMWGTGDRFGDQDPAMRRLGGGNLYGMSGWRHSPVRESPLRMRGRDPAETTAEKASKMEEHLRDIKSALEPVRK